jgi:hypothetical protein
MLVGMESTSSSYGCGPLERGIPGAVNADLALGDDFQRGGGLKRHHVAPLGDCGRADLKFSGDFCLRPEVRDGYGFEHEPEANRSYCLLQLQLAEQSLTLVTMKQPPKDLKTIRDRLAWAMTRVTPEITNADLVRACKAEKETISSAAVAKWFTSPKSPEFIKPGYLFPIAKRLTVDAEWLATGRGQWDKGTRTDAGIPYRRIALIQAYSTLPPEVRMSIRALIETLATAHSDNYAQWSRQEAEHARTRDSFREPATE